MYHLSIISTIQIFLQLWNLCYFGWIGWLLFEDHVIRKNAIGERLWFCSSPCYQFDSNEPLFKNIFLKNTIFNTRITETPHAGDPETFWGHDSAHLVLWGLGNILWNGQRNFPPLYNCVPLSLTPSSKESTHLLLGELEATCYPGEGYHSSDALSLRVNYREHSHYSLPVPSWAFIAGRSALDWGVLDTYCIFLY